MGLNCSGGGFERWPARVECLVKHSILVFLLWPTESTGGSRHPREYSTSSSTLKL